MAMQKTNSEWVNVKLRRPPRRHPTRGEVKAFSNQVFREGRLRSKSSISALKNKKEPTPRRLGDKFSRHRKWGPRERQEKQEITQQPQ